VVDIREFLPLPAIAAPLLAAAAVHGDGTPWARRWAATAAGISLCCSIAAATGPDSFSAIPMVLFSLIALVTFAAAPERDAQGPPLAGMLVIFGGTLAAYAAPSLTLFFAAWTLTVSPFFTGCFQTASPAAVWNRPRMALAMGAGLLAAAAALDATGLQSPEIRRAIFVLLMFAALVKKGIVPFHGWVTSAFEHGPPQAPALLFNGHLGAFLIIRFAIPHYNEVAREALPWMAAIALLTAIYASFTAFAETKPRRILALLTVSQASFVLAGIQNRNEQGITGALVHWIVVALATTGLVCAYRAVEVRYAGAENPSGYLGLGARVPRLAVLFSLCGLALVGMPGTLGFAAEDLLFHGALESNPWLGLALPVATACNAITILRLLSTLFLGRGPSAVAPVPDALPRERWSLTATVAGLVVLGLVPSLAITLRSPAAATLAKLLE
jgi:NADH-quinone oxidoreductase subunit M